MPEHTGQGTRVEAQAGPSYFRMQAAESRLFTWLRSMLVLTRLQPALRDRQVLGTGEGAIRWAGVECLCHPDAGRPWETGEHHAISKLGV